MAGMLSAHVSDFKNASAIILNLFCVLVYQGCPKFMGYLVEEGQATLYIYVYIMRNSYKKHRLVQNSTLQTMILEHERKSKITSECLEFKSRME